MDNYNFKGKRALVTGAGKGIGRCVAIQLAKLGAKVFALSRTQSDLDSLQLQVPTIETMLVDIADWDNTRAVVENIGEIDLLVNNAGVLKLTTFLEATKDDFDNQMNINFRAAFNISQVVARGMVARGKGGAIVNISSITTLRTVDSHVCYGSSKAAMDMFTKNLAVELGPKKIRVNSINPGPVKTGMIDWITSDAEISKKIRERTPMRSFAEVEDVANAVVFLLSDKASMINGAVLPLDGGVILGCF